MLEYFRGSTSGNHADACCFDAECRLEGDAPGSSGDGYSIAEIAIINLAAAISTLQFRP
jgi:hypothetical protein